MTSPNRQTIRAHFNDTLEKIDAFGMSLFGLAEHDVLGLDECEQRVGVNVKVVTATDALAALVRLTPTTAALVAEVDSNIERALQDPFAIGFPVSDPETEVFIHEETLRNYASRIGAIHQLGEIDARKGFSASQTHLADICKNIGGTIRHLIEKKVVAEPAREAIVKHHLFAAVRATFPDAVPDGTVSFDGLVQSAPDFGVPRLKTCVELKVARTTADMSKVIGQIIDDQSLYGSNEYTNFIGVIYTSDETITDATIQAEIDERQRKLGADPLFGWTWLISRGPLASQDRKDQGAGQ